MDLVSFLLEAEARVVELRKSTTRSRGQIRVDGGHGCGRDLKDFVTVFAEYNSKITHLYLPEIGGNVPRRESDVAYAYLQPVCLGEVKKECQ